MIADLAPFAALGLAGSLHCIGMCGGLTVLATARGAARGRAALLTETAAFLLGKSSAYAVLGAGASALLTALPLAHETLELARQVLAWCAAVVLLVAGLSLSGLRTRIGIRVPSRITAPLARAYTGVRALPGPTGALGAGFLTGFLPCGLSWSAVLVAAASSPAIAVVGPFVFGARDRVRPGRSRAGLARRGRLGAAALVRVVAGPALVLVALLTAWRAGAPGEPAPCCAEAPGHTAATQ